MPKWMDRQYRPHCEPPDFEESVRRAREIADQQPQKNTRPFTLSAADIAALKEHAERERRRRAEIQEAADRARVQMRETDARKWMQEDATARVLARYRK